LHGPQDGAGAVRAAGRVRRGHGRGEHRLRGDPDGRGGGGPPHQRRRLERGPRRHLPRRLARGARLAPHRQRRSPPHRLLRRVDSSVGSPPVGAHGLVWHLMFCHGFVGLALMGTWMFVEVARSGRPRSRKGWWSHLAVVIALVQIPYYGLLPLIVVVGLAVGIT